MTNVGASPPVPAWQEMQVCPGSMDAEPLVPWFQVVLLVQVGGALSGSGGGAPASPPHEPEEYPPLIQFCNVAISAAVAAEAGAGGMGEVVFCIRCSATWASVIELFERSALVRSA